MNITGRAALAAGLLLPALIAGVYGAGWLVMWLLNVPGRLDALTYWHYVQSIDLAAFQPFADKIRLAGYIGFGVPLLVWVGTVVALLWGLRLDDLFDLSEPASAEEDRLVSGTAPAQRASVKASWQPARTSFAAPTHLPPVPPALREMLKDYPEHIEEIQRALNRVLEKKPLPGVPPFERALWMLEGTLNRFIDEARDQLELAGAAGDPEEIAKAKQRELLMLRARLQRDWDDLWEFFEGSKGASA